MSSTTVHASTARRHPPEPGRAGAGIAAVAMLLGVVVAVLSIAVVVLVKVADDARDDANLAARSMSGGTAPTSAHSHSGAAVPSGAAVGGLTSYAGAAPANADELAMAHVPYDAALPAAPGGPVARVHMTLKDMTLQIAPGVRYQSWSFDGTGAPGPVIHVREGQKVVMTLTNGGAIPHSIDFHAARIAPNKAFRDVAPGESFSFSFVAGDPGVYMYHCGTKPVLAHIANGMYGAIVVEPVTHPLPKADHEYVLVSSDWYRNGDGVKEPAQLDMNKAHAQLPDWVTWNGYAGQYVKHPLTADPGETVRFWVVAAGPSFDSDFHVVGTLLDRAWANGDVTSAPQVGVQTVSVPAGGGGVFDVKIDEPGLYPFVSHSFASVDLGQVGLLKVGKVEGTMSH
jgi:nitrite reductase (NO-forming)